MRQEKGERSATCLAHDQRQYEGAPMTKIIRPIRVEGNVAFVTLPRKGNPPLFAVIDAADVPLVEGFNWHSCRQEHTTYAARTVCGRKLLMHRVLMGDPSCLEVDHRDCDGLNNRRTNLRMATSSQNGMNRRIQSNNTSGLKGVSWSRRYGKWQAQVKIRRKAIHLGYFKSPEDAHAAYCEASADLHGDFGRAA